MINNVIVGETDSVLEVNRTYKNDFFSVVFKHPGYLKEAAMLFSRQSAEKIQITQVKPILLGSKENDLSFLLNEVFYYMIEVQSTPSRNMPFRILQYVATGLLSFVNEKELYQERIVKIKVPKLYTVFTGLCKKQPIEVVNKLRLSDAFEIPQDLPDLEVVVHTYDFNMTGQETQKYLTSGRFPERFSPFKGNAVLWYAIFINCIDYSYKSHLSKSESEKVLIMKDICQLFKERGIFVELFSNPEVVNLTVMEFSRENQMKYAHIEQGIEQGIERGIDIKEQEIVFNLLRGNYPDEMILSITSISTAALDLYKVKYQEATS